jgi:hypothetical protein
MTSSSLSDEGMRFLEETELKQVQFKSTHFISNTFNTHYMKNLRNLFPLPSVRLLRMQ